MFHMNLHIFIHRNITECNTTTMKITVNINANIPALTRPTPTHYKLCFLCMAHACPYDRESRRMIFSATVTSYIQVTKNSDLHMVTTSPYKGHTSHHSVLRLPHRTSRLLCHISRLPKILLWLCLTLLTMLALWGAPYE